MGCYNSTPDKRSFILETSLKDQEERDYTSSFQYQVVCPVEALFSDFNHKTPLHLATKSSNSRYVNDSIS